MISYMVAIYSQDSQLAIHYKACRILNIQLASYVLQVLHLKLSKEVKC